MIAKRRTEVELGWRCIGGADHSVASFDDIALTVRLTVKDSGMGNGWWTQGHTTTTSMRPHKILLVLNTCSNSG